MIQALDHLNIRTARLDAMIEWYTEVLGMTPGPRPPFPFPGAWLYANEHPLVHLVAVDPAPDAPGNLQLEHGAFRATGFTAFRHRLTERGERHEIVRVPDFPIVQINVWDPDGNHLHIDFDAEDVPADV